MSDLDKFLAEANLTDEELSKKRFRVLEELVSTGVANADEYLELNRLRRASVFERLRAADKGE